MLLLTARPLCTVSRARCRRRPLHGPRCGLAQPQADHCSGLLDLESGDRGHGELERVLVFADLSLAPGLGRGLQQPCLVLHDCGPLPARPTPDGERYVERLCHTLRACLLLQFEKKKKKSEGRN